MHSRVHSPSMRWVTSVPIPKYSCLLAFVSPTKWWSILPFFPTDCTITNIIRLSLLLQEFTEASNTLLWLHCSPLCWVQNSPPSDLPSPPLCPSPGLGPLACPQTPPIFLPIATSMAPDFSASTISCVLEYLPQDPFTTALSVPSPSCKIPSLNFVGCFSPFYCPLQSGIQ